MQYFAMLIEETPLVSVIIPCYNHGRYLAEAIRSVQGQSHPNTEIVVVDDGSSDNTREVAQGFEGVIYVYQSNRGHSAARNTGIARSRGDYLVFLDADDWLLPGALETNLRYLQKDPRLAFVSGGYHLIYVPEQRSWDVTREVPDNHYRHLLRENYIGMLASVMFPRRAIQAAPFDTTLKACEDYDLYLRLAREYPVAHHTALMAVYRIHTENTSGNYRLMLRTALEVLRRQQKRLRSPEEQTACRLGLAHFKAYYTEKIYDRLIYNGKQGRKDDLRDVLMLHRYNKGFFQNYLRAKKKRLAAKWIRWQRRLFSLISPI